MFRYLPYYVNYKHGMFGYLPFLHISSSIFRYLPHLGILFIMFGYLPYLCLLQSMFGYILYLHILYSMFANLQKILTFHHRLFKNVKNKYVTLFFLSYPFSFFLELKEIFPQPLFLKVLI